MTRKTSVARKGLHSAMIARNKSVNAREKSLWDVFENIGHLNDKCTYTTISLFTVGEIVYIIIKRV